MNNLGIYSKVSTAVLGLITSILFIGCMREEEELPQASFPDVGSIFTDDSFIGLGSNFFFPFVDGGAKPEVFSVDETEGYVGTSSIRIDVPDADDPAGSFAGATFIIDGFGRNLTQYTALTFWAKASESATIAEFGFGVNNSGSRYQTAATNLNLSTNWQRFIIPIPDPSKLVNEKGMMWFAASGNCPAGDGQCFPENPEGGTKKGFTFWLDEIQFENIGTIGQARAQIQNGRDDVVAGFIGQQLTVSGVNVSFNMPNGIDIPLNTTSAFFDYEVSNPDVVTTTGSTITIVGEGTTTITAKMGDIDASGSLTVQTISKAPVPTRDSRNVISVFSDSYNNVPVDFFNGFFIPDGQTTLGGAIETTPGENIINYSDLNFVIPTFTNPTIDADDMTHLHLDIFTFDDTENAQLEIGLVDLGSDANFGGGNDVAGRFFFEGSGLQSGEWIPLDIRLDEFDGLGAKSNLGQLILVSQQIDNLILDNIYFYAESPAQDASLSEILVNGVPIDDFASGILSYPVEVPSSGIVPEITATPNNEDGQVSVTPATEVPGTTIITVTAANGVSTQTYTVELIASDIADVTLSDLQVDGVTLEGFSPGITNYTIDLPDGTTAAPVVSATASDPEATLFINDAPGVPGTTVVEVTGRDGTSQNTYRITFNAGEVQGPVELITNGGFENGATGWTTNYGGPDIRTEGGNSFFFAEVGTAGQPFDVNMSQILEISQGETYTLSFDASTGAGNTRTIVTGIGLNEGAFTSATETITLTENMQTFTLMLTASDFGGANSRVLFDLGGDIGVVVIDNVSLLGAGSGGSSGSGPSLSDLQVDGTTVSGFSASTTSYTVELSSGTTTVPTVTAMADGNGTVNVTAATAIPGTTTVVVSADGQQTTYTINFTIESGPVELITNGDFENGATGWTTNYGGPDIRTEGGNSFFFAEVGTAGQPFDVNMSQILEITQGSTYTLTFDASTGAGSTRTIVTGIGLNEGAFTAATETITLTESSQTFTLTLTASDFGSTNSRVLFDLGGDVGVVVLDNISLIEN